MQDIAKNYRGLEEIGIRRNKVSQEDMLTKNKQFNTRYKIKSN